MALQLVALDLDGTLLTTAKRACASALQTLHSLQGLAVRVVATGRSLSSASQVLPHDAPLDYVVAGSGSIIVHWPSQRTVDSARVAGGSGRIAATLARHRIPFFVLRAPPNSHEALGYVPADLADCRESPVADDLAEFKRRWAIYRASTQPLPIDGTDLGEAAMDAAIASRFPEGISQFLMMGLRDPDAVAQIALDASDPEHPVRAVFTTSDTGVRWVEILPQHVSKSLALQRVADLHGVSRADCVAVGNDWNDRDMLEWSGRGWLVANAAAALKDEAVAKWGHVSVTSATNDEGGVDEVLRRMLRAER